MTIEQSYLQVEKYAGDGVTKTFGFGFRVFEAADIVVIATDTSGVESTLNPETDYTVAINSSGFGGTVTIGKTPITNTVLVITRRVPVKQEVDLVNQGEFYAETHEEVFDRLTAIAQDMYEQLSRTLVVPISQNKTPQQVLTEVLDIAATANAYVATAKQILVDNQVVRDEVKSYAKTAQTLEPYKDEIQNVSANIGSVTVVFESLTDVKKVANNINNVNKAAANETNINAAVSNASNINTVSTNIADVKNVARIAPSVVTVANSTGQIESVLDYIDPITTVGGSIEAIREIAGDIDSETWSDTEDYGNVGDAITSRKPVGGNIVIVAENIDKIQAIGPIVSEIETVGKIPNDVKKVSSISSAVSTVSDIQAHVTAVSGISADVQTVSRNRSAVSTVSSSVSNVNTVATNIASVQTVSANINDVKAVSQIKDKVVAVSEFAPQAQTIIDNADAIQSVGGYADEIRTVASGLTSEIESGVEDYGNVGDAIGDPVLTGGEVKTVADFIPTLNENLELIQSAPSYAERAEAAAKIAENAAEAIGDPISKTEATNTFVGKDSFAEEFNALNGTFDYGDLS